MKWVTAWFGIWILFLITAIVIIPMDKTIALSLFIGEFTAGGFVLGFGAGKRKPDLFEI